ncbi:MAG TPA: OsmC family protein [Atribacteraceae bacterium]|nr:OsmC family protein [Atribacteraceae bacterium]
MPEMQFKVNGKWSGCMRVDSMIRQFTVRFDEPPTLGGEDSAPNPVEVLLSSLVGCLGIVVCVVAGERKMAFRGIEIDVDGDLDPRGFMGQYDQVRPGFLAIRYTVRIDGDLSEEEMQLLYEEVEKRCPVSDTLKYGTKVEGRVVKA